MLILHYATFLATIGHVIKAIGDAVVQAIWHELLRQIVPEGRLILIELPD
jgi:hypothetical protein